MKTFVRKRLYTHDIIHPYSHTLFSYIRHHSYSHTYCIITMTSLSSYIHNILSYLHTLLAYIHDIIHIHILSHHNDMTLCIHTNIT